MAVLDAMHSLLALDGATSIMGSMQVLGLGLGLGLSRGSTSITPNHDPNPNTSMQVLLVQAVVPLSMLVAPCLPADPKRRPAYSNPNLTQTRTRTRTLTLTLTLT